MQLASHGMRGIPRNVPNILPGGHTTRGIHIPSFRPPTTTGTAKRLISETRTFLTRFVGHLTAPGLQHPYATQSLTQAVRGSAPGRMASIQQRMSHPVRNALARPVQPLFFPHAPTFVNRSVVQVGLGSARKFSTSRPLFQNIIDNVPVTGRALYEADWELDMKANRSMMKRPVTKGKDKTRSKEMMKPKAKTFVVESVVPSEPSVPEFDRYFPTVDTPAVTTYLLIPLAPTPTNRVPLPLDTTPHPSLLPLPALGSIHHSHELHSLRVSTLFSRLDVANVWEKGVTCHSYASRASLEGVCTILKVEFVGWTKAEVRGVIGESGTGWCVMEEVQTQREIDEDDDNLSDTSSILSGISGDCEGLSPGVATPAEPSQSLVLPTLDFSTDFLTSAEAASRPPTSASSSVVDLFSDSEMDSDPWADSASSDGSWTDAAPAEQWYGFSSDFARRVDANSEWVEPLESVF